MDINKVEERMDILDTLNEIKELTEEEDSHWWSFLTPDYKIWSRDGIKMPEVLRKEFIKALDRCIGQIEKQI